MKKIEIKNIRNIIKTFCSLFGFFTVFVFYFNTFANVSTSTKNPKTDSTFSKDEVNDMIDARFAEAFRQFEIWYNNQKGFDSATDPQFESFDKNKVMAFFKEAAEKPHMLVRYIAFYSQPHTFSPPAIDDINDRNPVVEFTPYLFPLPKIQKPDGYPADFFRTFFISHFDLNNEDHVKGFLDEHHALFESQGMESHEEFNGMIEGFMEGFHTNPMTANIATAHFEDFKPSLYSMAMRDMYSPDPEEYSSLLVESMRNDLETGDSHFILSAKFKLPSREEDIEGYRREVFTHIVSNFFHNQNNNGFSENDGEGFSSFSFGFHQQPSDQTDEENQTFKRRNPFTNTILLVKWLNEDDFMEVASNFMAENSPDEESTFQPKPFVGE